MAEATRAALAARVAELTSVLATEKADKARLQARVETLEERAGLLHSYVAVNSPGQPVCVSGPGPGAGDDLAAELYLHEGALVGVRVTSGEGIVGGAGLVPFYDEEPAGFSR